MTAAADPLRSLDLNLLLVLDTLLRARNVTRAAEKLGLSQSATSHALARLRTVLGDELMVRGPGGLVPTARAEALAEPLAHAMATLRSAVEAPQRFDAAASTRDFTLATTDYVQWVLLPQLVAKLRARAPGVNLWILSLSHEEIDARLAEGSLDLDLGVVRRHQPPGMMARRLFEERFVCIARHGHPEICGEIGLDTYVRLPHAFVAPRGRKGGVVDTALAELGLSRRVALAVPHFLIMPSLIAASDFVATLAERVATGFANHLPLQVFEPPLPLPNFAIQMTWHERSQRDPAHQWLRKLVAETASTIGHADA